MGLTRRGFMRVGLGAGAGLLVAGTARADGADGFGALQPPDANGIRLSPGFASRRVATSGQVAAPGSSYVWPNAPDGGAIFEDVGGGWIYTSNSERSSGAGGCGALCFDAAGNVVDAYSILSGTSRNCGGGKTPWNTWISCEEINGGLCWECDPFAPGAGTPLLALGTFKHEAIAVDPVGETLYLTEDQSNSNFYRFIPDAYPALSSGTLEVAEVSWGLPTSYGDLRSLLWHPLVDPNPAGGGVQSATGPLADRATRFQVSQATPFNGGEGIDYFQDRVYFTTKGDNRVWSVDVANDTIELLYDDDVSTNPILSGVDNVWVAGSGDVYVAEDGGDMQIVALTPSGGVVPVLQGPDIGGNSEICGPSLSADGSRLYYSSQRGGSGSGATYEIRGPFTSISVPLGGGTQLAIAAGLLTLARLKTLRTPDADDR